VASQAEVDLVVNATRTLPQLERNLDRVLRAAQADMSDLNVNAVLNQTATLNQLDRDLDRVIAAARNGADDIDLDAALNQQASIRTVRNQLDRLVTAVNADGSIPPALVTASLNAPASLNNIRHDLNAVVRTAQATAPDIDVDADVDRNVLGKLGGLAGSFGRVTGTVTKLTTSLGAVVPLLASVATAIQNILPAAAIATQGILAMKLATATLKLGLVGVNEAISSAFDPETKPEDLAKQIQGLAPEARKFVTEIVSMRKELKDLQLGVQNRLFKDLDSSLATLAKAALPDVRSALNETATSLNGMGRGVASAATALAKDGTLGTALDGATTGIQNLSKVPAQATTAFGQLAAAAAPAFDRVTKAVARVATSVSERLSGAFKSGALEDAIGGAVDAIAQLGRIFGNVFSGIGNAIKAVSTGGDGLFGTLEKVSQAFEDLTATKGFTEGLRALSQTASTVASTLLPLLSTALQIVGTTLATLAKPVQQFVSTLGSALGPVLTALGPVLISLAGAFGSLLGALGPIFELISNVIVAVLPTFTVLFETLGRVLETLTPVISSLADVLAAILVPVLSAIGPLLEVILPPFVELAETIFPILADVLTQLAPSFELVSVALADLLVALSPLIPVFVDLIDGPLTKLIEIAAPLLVVALTTILLGITAVADFITNVAIPAVKAIGDLFTGDFSGALDSAGQALSGLKDLVKSVFDRINTVTRGALGTFVRTVKDKASEAGSNLLDSIQDKGGELLDYIGDLPGRIGSALGDLGHLLYDAGASLISGLIDGIQSKIGAVTSTLSNLTSKLPDWKGPAEVDARILTPSGELLIDGLIAGIQRAVPRVRAELQGLTGQLPQFGPQLAGVSAPTATIAPPVVYVSIGNEAVDQYVTVRSEQVYDQRARTAAQGVRF
jgi:phage-related protein